MVVEQERPPYEAYAAIAASFAALLATAGAFGRLLDRDPQCQTALDFAILALASFKAARTLAHDRVSAPMRAPFVEGEAGAEDEVPIRSGGMQQAIGELVTCTRCAGAWAAAGLVSTQIVAPRFGRLLTWSLGAAAANDFLRRASTRSAARRTSSTKPARARAAGGSAPGPQPVR